jgi:hypothetical protein
VEIDATRMCQLLRQGERRGRNPRRSDVRWGQNVCWLGAGVAEVRPHQRRATSVLESSVQPMAYPWSSGAPDSRSRAAKRPPGWSGA